MAETQPVAVSHSIPTPDAVSTFVADRWDQGAVLSCLLVRSYVNDVFKVTTSRSNWVLKVYRRGWRTAWDARWEAELCSQISAQGIEVALPVAGGDGEAVQVLSTPEGDRAAMLTPWLPGAKPQPPFTPELYRDFGRTAAMFHEATRDFHSTAPGRLLNAGHLIRRPVAKLESSFPDRQEDFARLQKVAEEVTASLDALTPGLPFGVCHGDLTLDNLHVLPDGSIAFYDFCLSGHGWFALDFAGFHGWVSRDATALPKWQAFQQGYCEVRPISDEEFSAVPYFDIAYQIWDLEHTMHNWSAWSGSWRSADEKVDTMLAEIFAAAGKVGTAAFTHKGPRHRHCRRH